MNEAGPDIKRSNLKAQFRKYGRSVLARFNNIREKYGKSANNMRGLFAVAASCTLLPSAITAGDPVASAGGGLMLIGNVMDLCRGQKDKFFRASLLLCASGEFLAFYKHMAAHEWGALIAVPSLFVYYGIGLTEKKWASSFGQAHSKAARIILGNPRPLMSSFDIIGSAAPLCQAVRNGEWMWAFTTALLLADAVAHAISTSEDYRNGKKQEKSANRKVSSNTKTKPTIGMNRAYRRHGNLLPEVPKHPAERKTRAGCTNIRFNKRQF